MRIWLVQTGEELPMDGPATRLLRTALLAGELCRRGHEVVYINATFNHQRKLQRAEATQVFPADAQAGRPYACVLLQGRAYARNVSLARLRSHRENAAAFKAIAPTLPRPDAMLIGYPPIELADAAVEFARAHAIPCAVDCRDMWPEVFEERMPALLRPLGRQLLRGMYAQGARALAGADALVGITDAFLQWGLDRAGRTRRAADRVVHLTVSPVAPSDAAVAEGAETWAEMLPADWRGVIGCFAGTFASRTDLLTIVDGANLLSEEERQRCRIILCGKGDVEGELRQRAAGNPAVIIAGWRNVAEIAALMQRSQFGILPYPNTPDFLASYPNKVGEYLLSGLPILTGLNGVTGALLGAEGVGLRYEVGNAASACAALRSVLAAAPSAAQCAQCRAVGQRLFDPKTIYPSYADWLETLASARLETPSESRPQ